MWKKAGYQWNMYNNDLTGWGGQRPSMSKKKIDLNSVYIATVEFTA